jgi:hypothetical protein
MYFNFFGFIITLIVYIITRNVVLSIGAAVGTTNYLAATILIIIIASFVISLIATLREFKNYPGSKWQSKTFHTRLFTRFLINALLVIIINLIWQ